MRTIAKHGVRLLVATVTVAALPALTAVTPAHATDECIGTRPPVTATANTATAFTSRSTPPWTGASSSSTGATRITTSTSSAGAAGSRRDPVRGAWRGCVWELVGAEQRVVGHALHVQGAGLLQRVVRLGLHVLERVDVRHGRPGHLGVGPGADGDDGQHVPERTVSCLPLRDLCPGLPLTCISRSARSRINRVYSPR